MREYELACAQAQAASETNAVEMQRLAGKQADIHEKIAICKEEYDSEMEEIREAEAAIGDDGDGVENAEPFTNSQSCPRTGRAGLCNKI